MATGAKAQSFDKLRTQSRDLPPQVQEWQRWELRRYREAQERKWRNWYDAMFGTRP